MDLYLSKELNQNDTLIIYEYNESITEIAQQVSMGSNLTNLERKHAQLKNGVRKVILKS